MTQISIQPMEIMGNTYMVENRLPKFRDKVQDRELEGSGLLEHEKKLYGYQTGDRVLPYLMQDAYTREKKNVILKTIVMENDYIKAVFLPEYGMRLYSLYSKEEQRELLYKNPVLQFANLAIRNAWFSGGIEWNVGQLGHTFTTCSSVFAGIVKDGKGEKFLRCYEYERCKGIYWQLDFHLGKEDRQLSVYARFINPQKESIPFYWWTNIAVPEEKNIRVFSGNKNVIYILPESVEKTGATKGMAHGELPYLPSVPGEDASYPQRIPFSSEYFFQNEKDVKQTWEIAAYDDGTVFFDRATENLRFHKMFCWGSHRGGKHWKDFLAEPGKGDYVELQAGLAPTQVHGLEMPADTEWDFVQIFGGMKADYTKANGDWEKGRDYLYQKMNEVVSEEQLHCKQEQYREDGIREIVEILHFGTGYGALEEIRERGVTPEGMSFPMASVTPKEMIWLNLLNKEEVPELSAQELPLSYMVDLRYKTYLQAAAKKGSASAWNFLGIMCYENGEFEQGIHCFQESLKIRENALAYRNLFQAYKDIDLDRALNYMEKALGLFSDEIPREYVEEYTEVLVAQKQYKKAWEYYQTLDKKLQNWERIILNIMEAAVHEKKEEFMRAQYEKEFAVIREGERGYTEGYFAYQAMQEARIRGVEYNEALIEKYVQENNIPEEYDFRLSVI